MRLMHRSLLKDDFGINFKAARSFIETRQEQIAQLHQAGRVENTRSHNRQKGRDIQQLKSFIDSFEAVGMEEAIE